MPFLKWGTKDRAIGLCRGDQGGVSCAPIDVLLGNATATGLATASVDLVVADLPYGQHHSRLDVGAMLRELWRVVAVGGRVVMVGVALGGNVSGKKGACAASRAALGNSSPCRGAWHLLDTRALNIGGIEARAVVLRREFVAPKG